MADPHARFHGDDLPTLGDAVAEAILGDLRHNEDCDQSTADGEGNDGQRRSCADRTARAEASDSEDH